MSNKNKYFMISVNDDFCNNYFEDFLLTQFNMNVASTGCGSTEFICDKKPRNFEKKLLKRFGNVIYEVTQWRYMDYEN